MSSCNNYKVFIPTLLFPAFILSFVLSSPIPNSIYDKFISFATINKCTMPEDLKLPFQKSSDPSSFNFLSTPLIECRTSDVSNEYDEVYMLCTEIFDVLKNITCIRYNQSLSVIESDRFSEDVCHDFESLKNILPQKDNYLSRRLSDKIICKVLCSKKKFELCKTLLWSYDTLMKIEHALQNEKQVQKNESVDEDSSDKVIPPVKPSLDSVKLQPTSKSSKEPGKTKALISVNPHDGNLSEYDSNKTDQEYHNPKVSSDLDETTSEIISNKDLSDSQVQNEAKVKTTNIIKNVSTTVQQNKSEPKNENISLEDLKNSATLVESKNLSSMKLQTENIHDKENKNDASVPKNEITDLEEKVDKNSLTSNENEIKDKQDIENVAVNNSKNNGEYNFDLKDVKVDNNVESKPTEKTAKPVSPGNENELMSSNFPEEEDKPKQTDLESQDGKEIEKHKQIDYESPNENLPDTDKKMPEPSVQSTLPDEDVEHPEDKNQYNDNENEDDYPKSEYDNASNLPSKNKESVVQNPIAADTNQMTNGYSSNISPKDNIGRISEEIAMISPFPEQEDSHFFFYFLSIVLIIMAGYLIFHNKQKIIALIVEGRHERRRRSHGAGYKKLETK